MHILAEYFGLQMKCWIVVTKYGNGFIDGLVQERHNSSANALELCFSFTNPSICLDTNSMNCRNCIDILNNFSNLKLCRHLKPSLMENNTMDSCISMGSSQYKYYILLI